MNTHTTLRIVICIAAVMADGLARRRRTAAALGGAAGLVLGILFLQSLSGGT